MACAQVSAESVPGKPSGGECPGLSGGGVVGLRRQRSLSFLSAAKETETFGQDEPTAENKASLVLRRNVEIWKFKKNERYCDLRWDRTVAFQQKTVVKMRLFQWKTAGTDTSKYTY